MLTKADLIETLRNPKVDFKSSGELTASSMVSDFTLDGKRKIAWHTDNPTMLAVLVVVYSVLLIMYFELSNGVIRYSMLDTSIRTNEVYVMNPKKIVSKYHRSLITNPIIATLLAWFVLSANMILPAVVRIFSSDTAQRMEESVELTSVYGVALGTLFVFIVVGGLFGLNLPTHLQRYRESKADN